MSSHVNALQIAGEILVAGREYTVVSLHPIWAWAVLYAGKDVENRSWITDQRGRVLIHSSDQRVSLREDRALREELSFLSGIPRSVLPVTVARGAILGSIEIAGCVEDSCSRWAAVGKTHWLLRDPRTLATPITGVKGDARFWRWTYETQDARQATSMVVPRGTAPAHDSADEPARTESGVQFKAIDNDAVLAALRNASGGDVANELRTRPASAGSLRGASAGSLRGASAAMRGRRRI
jgi:hypothetical protein